MNIQVSGLFDSVLNRLSYATLLDTGEWINPLAQSFFYKRVMSLNLVVVKYPPYMLPPPQKKIRMAYSVKNIVTG